MVFVVLGMHKSGTTLVSRILHNSGINMGDFDDDISYDKGNKYEREEVLDLNYDILDAKDVNSIFIPIPKDTKLNGEQVQRLESIIESCTATHPEWGFKDPRTCFIYNLWHGYLPEGHKRIAIYRHPFEPWPRYRLSQRKNQWRNIFRAWRYLETWTVYNLNIIKYLKDYDEPYLLMGYHNLMTSTEEFKRLEAFAGRELVDMRKPSLYRNKAQENSLLTFTSQLIKYKYGKTPLEIMSELEELREKNIAQNRSESAVI